MDAVRKEAPSFAGTAPNAGSMPEAITRALQQLLAEHKLPGRVEYIASQDLSGRILGHVFSVTGVKMPICTMHFTGTQNVSEGKLAATAKELSEIDYSSELVRGFANVKLFALYREVGQLRAKFATPVAKQDAKCKNGVDLTIPVAEGLIYSWGQTNWSGATALTADQLNEILGMRPGEVANGLKLDKGLAAVTKAYDRYGYLDARVRPVAEFDDSAQKVSYTIEVREGPQYRMGVLTFKGLAERDAKALRSAWRLRRGEVFDRGYLEEFFKKDAGKALQGLFEERRAVGKPPPRVETKLNANKQTLTVDVTLELSN
jgi:outer membrane protein assembly factor BamA